MADPGYKLPIYEGSTKGDHDQWIRKWSLNIGSTEGSNWIGIRNDQAEAGELRVTFEVRQADNQTPQTCTITVYNLADETAMQIIREYSKINLQAGYVNGHYGTIFEGTVKQFKKGKESAIDSYLRIFAASGDVANNWGIVNTALPVGWTLPDMQDLLVNEQKKYGVTEGKIAKTEDVGGTMSAKSSRPAILYGSQVDEIAAYTATTRKTWTIHNNKIVIQDATAYALGDIIVINSGTGMVQVPEVTAEGIQVTCLLNPNLYIRCRVQLDNRTFNTMYAPGQGGNIRELHGQEGTAFPSPKFSPTSVFASTAWDGVYCIVMMEHQGDTRGLDWYTRLTCWAVDGTFVKGQQNAANA